MVAEQMLNLEELKKLQGPEGRIDTAKLQEKIRDYTQALYDEDHWGGRRQPLDAVRRLPFGDGLPVYNHVAQPAACYVVNRQGAGE